MHNTTNPLKNKDENKPGSIGQFGSEMKNKAQETGTAVLDKTKEFASNIGDKAKDAASTVSQKAEDLASNVGQKAEDATTAVGDSMKNLASTIRENAPLGGFVGSASSSVADTLESGGRYLQEEGLSGIADDLTNLIKRNPIPALLVGIGLGYMIARATRS
jgi:methyl-accepting chemotaxis protein